MYPRGSDPRTARRILSKSLSYAQEEVRNYRADWVDPADPSRGIVPREFLASGKLLAATLDQIEHLAVEGMNGPPPDVGLKFIPPPMEKNPTLPRINVESLVVAAPSWDWQMEPARA